LNTPSGFVLILACGLSGECMTKILDWFMGVTVYLLIVTVESISDAWDYITMRKNEDTRFD